MFDNIGNAYGHSPEEMLRIYYKLKNFNPIVVSESWRLIMIEVEISTYNRPSKKEGYFLWLVDKKT